MMNENIRPDIENQNQDKRFAESTLDSPNVIFNVNLIKNIQISFVIFYYFSFITLIFIPIFSILSVILFIYVLVSMVIIPINKQVKNRIIIIKILILLFSSLPMFIYYNLSRYGEYLVTKSLLINYEVLSFTKIGIIIITISIGISISLGLYIVLNNIYQSYQFYPEIMLTFLPAILTIPLSLLLIISNIVYLLINIILICIGLYVYYIINYFIKQQQLKNENIRNNANEN